MSHSRIPAFYKYSVAERLRLLVERGVISASERDMLADGGQMLDADTADRMVENVIATFGLPLGLGLNFSVNARDYVVPMVVEEPSIVAAVSAAAKLARDAGGFSVQTDPPRLIGQIQVVDVAEPQAAIAALNARADEIISLANSLHPNMVARGGGAQSIEVVDHGRTRSCGHMLAVHLIVDTRDAMGANLVNTMCEGTAPLVAQVSGGDVFLRILSNLADRAMARARVTIPAATLASNGFSGERVRDGIVRANEFAEIDAHRAATHNKGIMNGIDAVAIATGNDWRALEAAAHAYAAADGRYRALTRWYVDADGALVGELNMPLKVGTVGGQIESNQAVRIAHRVLGVTGARELAAVMGAVGLAQNLAALKALSTDGIQSGHMTLHARSVAIAAGAGDALFDQVVERLVASGQVKVWKAREIIAALDLGAGRSVATTGARQAPADVGYGKIIVLGEHAVVYGRHALAVPCPLAVRARAHRQPRDVDLLIPDWGVELRLSQPEGAISSLHASLKLIVDRLGVADRGMRIEVFPEVPRANGLGASAALAVAVIRAVARCWDVQLTERAISALAFDCEKIAHGTPSGIDNTLATYGRPIAYRRAEGAARPEMRDLAIGRPLPLVIGQTGVATLTAQTVGAVRSAWQKHPERYEAIFSQIDALALAGIDALKQGDLAELGELMNLDHGLLNALGVSSGALESLVAIARDNGALGAKLTGGGGGGAMIALAEPDGAAAIAAAMRRRGYRASVAEVG